jgi:hypothetical protein
LVIVYSKKIAASKFCFALFKNSQIAKAANFYIKVLADDELDLPKNFRVIRKLPNLSIVRNEANVFSQEWLQTDFPIVSH